MLTDLLMSWNIHPMLMLIAIMLLIFILGWPLEWVPIVLIILPILMPLVREMGYNLLWFCTLVAVTLQTAWLSPPVALSAYFLKGVVPDWDLKDIYIGMMQFMVLQMLGLFIIIFFPVIVTWLPAYLAR
jgi:TRAP-type mannitol/chloroaromatic compound transport system permease large subunit